MKFMAIADSDIGIVKDTNQDSLLIKHADTQRGEVLLAIVCDECYRNKSLFGLV